MSWEIVMWQFILFIDSTADKMFTFLAVNKKVIPSSRPYNEYAREEIWPVISSFVDFVQKNTVIFQYSLNCSCFF